MGKENPMAISKSSLLTTDEAAAYLNVHPSTLEKGRQSHRKGLFPPFCRIGKAVRYREADLERWLDNNLVEVGEVIS
jgi:excisionase family DNA binding protein